MLKSSFCMGIAIAGAAFLAESAIASSLPSRQSEPTLRQDANAPLCYIQFRGSSAIDVSHVCGKKAGETPVNVAAVAVSGAAPPVFDPKMMNASTTGQCNFVDANGNPCLQK